MTREQAPRVWVSLDLASLAHEPVDFDPDYVTQRLGVTPTQSNRLGDQISDHGGRRSFTRWRLAVGPTETIDASPLFRELMDRLKPADGRLGILCRELGLAPKLTCTVAPRSAASPDITFEKDVVEWAAANGVVLAVDLMLWRNDD